MFVPFETRAKTPFPMNLKNSLMCLRDSGVTAAAAATEDDYCNLGLNCATDKAQKSLRVLRLLLIKKEFFLL